jgi:hypothetical protein
MAKSRSIFKLSGTLKGITHVSSTAYGDHVRAARGTYTPVTLNESFKESGKALQLSNVFAKLIKDALDPYRANFKDGTLWRRLVSHFRQQLKDNNNGVDFRSLLGFQCIRTICLKGW